MLLQETSEDFVIATGRQYSVCNFVRMSAHCLGVTLHFEGKGIDEIAFLERVEGPDTPALKQGDTIVRVAPRYRRPTQVETLLGGPDEGAREARLASAVTLEGLCAGKNGRQRSKPRQTLRVVATVRVTWYPIPREWGTR